MASVSTREIQNVDAIANDLYTRISIPDAYRIDAKPFIERPFFAGTVAFPASAARYSILNSPIKSLPGDVIRSNVALLNAMKIATLYRSDLVLNISMAGTITHAGCVLVAALPPLLVHPATSINNEELINSLLTSPHAFLHANEATSINLTIPWYCNTDLASLTMDATETTLDFNGTKGNYATLVFLVLNPLAPSTGSSTSLSIVIEACFKNLDILVPSPRFATWTAQTKDSSAKTGLKPLITMTKNGLKAITGDFIDYGIGALASLVGLHNPNHAVIDERHIMTQRNFQNLVDGEQFFEKLDPNANYNRTMQEPTFGSTVDEMSISHIVSKRQMLGSFEVSVNDASGKLYWARPISPYQGGLYPYTGTSPFNVFSNNLELMHTLHRAWRGDLKITIQAVMNNKQQCKLKLIKLYNPPKNALTGSPTYQSIANAPSHLMEFTQGGQEHEIVMPFLSRNELMPCSEDQLLEAFLHGIYYIYLAQPLANSDGSPTTITFNVFMTGEPNLTFYGYSTRPIRNFLPQLPETTTFVAQSGGDPIRVMNEPQRQKDKLKQDSKELALNFMDRLLPNFDIRPLQRRMYLHDPTNFTVLPNSSTTVNVPLSRFVGESSFSTRSDTAIPSTPIVSTSFMYYSKNVGFKMFMEFSRNSYATNVAPLANIDVKIFYIPPGLTYDPITFTTCFSFPNVNMNSSTKYCVLPFQVSPIQENPNSICYEFVVPNVTLFKYMGSPNKYHSGINRLTLANADFGVVAVLVNNQHSTDTVSLKMDLSVGLTDESRFGHHVMAPLFGIDKDSSPYLSTASIPFSLAKNANIYKGGFL